MCLLVPYCRGHPVHHRCQDVAGIAKAVHPDAALAHHQDGPAARCSDDIVGALQQPAACLASHRDVTVQAQNLALQDARDSAAKLRVRRQDVELRAPLRRDVLLQACFLVLLQAAVVRRAAPQKQPAQRRDGLPRLQRETLARMKRALRPRVWCRSDESWDGSRSRLQVRQVVQHREPLQGPLREHAPQHRA